MGNAFASACYFTAMKKGVFHDPRILRYLPVSVVALGQLLQWDFAFINSRCCPAYWHSSARIFDKHMKTTIAERYRYPRMMMPFGIFAWQQALLLRNVLSNFPVESLSPALQRKRLANEAFIERKLADATARMKKLNPQLAHIQTPTWGIQAAFMEGCARMLWPDGSCFGKPCRMLAMCIPIRRVGFTALARLRRLPSSLKVGM
jgi:hypothetical protein